MSALSLRHRLAAWYLGVLALALLALAAASWWLFGRAVTVSADASLEARIARARAFIEAAQRNVVPTELSDELREFGQLSAGEALIEVRDGDHVVYTPGVEGWASLAIEAKQGGPVVFADRAALGRPYRVAASTFADAGHVYHVLAALPLAAALDARREFGWLLAIALPVLGLVAGAGGYWISGRAITLGRLQASLAEMARFTSEAAHELRTPVTLIRATADVTLARPRSEDEYRQALVDVQAQAERMSRLVADLLALARADAGVEALDRSPADLRAVAERAARDVQPALSQRQLTLDLRMPQPVMAAGGEDSLRRLLMILLDNAIKYTPVGGRLSLTAEAGADGGAVIEVIDNGPGIEPAERPFVFDRFYRGAAARAATDGSGLGLSLAKAIVERYRGRIELSDAPSGGCRVTVRFPAELR